MLIVKEGTDRGSTGITGIHAVLLPETSKIVYWSKAPTPDTEPQPGRLKQSVLFACKYFASFIRTVVMNTLESFWSTREAGSSSALQAIDNSEKSGKCRTWESNND